MPISKKKNICNMSRIIPESCFHSTNGSSFRHSCRFTTDPYGQKSQFHISYNHHTSLKIIFQERMMGTFNQHLPMILSYYWHQSKPTSLHESDFRAVKNLVGMHPIAGAPASLYILTESVPHPYFHLQIAFKSIWN